MSSTVEKRGRPRIGYDPLTVVLTPEQRAWLEGRTTAHPEGTLAAVVRDIVQRAMDDHLGLRCQVCGATKTLRADGTRKCVRGPHVGEG